MPASSDKGTNLIIQAALRNPISAFTLVAVIFGGVSVYYRMSEDISNLRRELIVTSDRAAVELKTAAEKGTVNNVRQDAEIAQTKVRLERLETFITDVRADIREISTMMKFIVRPPQEQKNP